MYTECPECQTAFRLTVTVLRKAHGRVRCGGCGQVFDALEHLHEDSPDGVAGQADETSAGDRFERQSKELLESLDQLSGAEDVRIEDTGIEWRVYETADDADAAGAAEDDGEGLYFVTEEFPDDDAGNDAEGDSADDASAEPGAPPAANAGNDNDLAIRDTVTGDIAAPEWKIDDDDVGEAVDADAQAHDPAMVEEQAHTGAADSEWRMDEVAATAPPTEAAAADAPDDATPTATPPADNEAPAHRVAIDSDADDDAFAHELATDGAADDFVTEAPIDSAADAAVTEAPIDDAADDTDAAAEPAVDSVTDEPAAATDAPVDSADNDAVDATADDPGEMRFDDNTPLPDELLTPTGSGSAPYAEATETGSPPEPVEPQADIALGEPDDWLALLDEVGDATDGRRDEPVTTEVDPATDDDAADRADDLADTGIREYDDEPTIAREHVDAFTEIASSQEHEPPAATDAGADRQLSLTDDAAGELAAIEAFIDADDAGNATTDEPLPSDVAEEPAQDSDIALDTGDDVIARAAAAEAELEAALLESHGDISDDNSSADELERSMNIQIDQELMQALADRSAAPYEAPDSEEQASSSGPLFETIIMEGDSFRDATDDDESADVDASSRFGPIEIPPLAQSGVHELPSPRLHRAGIAALILLALVLLAQLVHANREHLATYGVFDRTLGPVYRVFGAPVAPAWNVRGWQFESTNGSTDADNRVLTIYSRIANKSELALPYPLVHVSLTDRFEDVIGSRVLAADDYLAGAANPHRPVEAGRTFTAVIAIDSPASEATGFKLNVCYRIVAKRLRCAVEDFRN